MILGRYSSVSGAIRAGLWLLEEHETRVRALEAEDFVETADLSEYDLSGFTPMRFEIEPKAASLNMRLPAVLLDAVKAKARASGIPYTRYVRMLL